MKVDETVKQHITEFWRWFAEGPGQLGIGEELPDEQMFAISDQLEERFPGVSTEMEGGAGGEITLTFTLVMNRDAEDRRRNAPIVRALVDSAPHLHSWKFQAFAKPIAWMDAFLPQLDFPVGSRLAVDAVRFEKVSADPAGLRVYVPHYAAAHHDHFVIAVERMLEAGLGEGWVLERLGTMELRDAAVAASTARPIEDLGELEGTHSA